MSDTIYSPAMWTLPPAQAGPAAAGGFFAGSTSASASKGGFDSGTPFYEMLASFSDKTLSSSEDGRGGVPFDIQPIGEGEKLKFNAEVQDSAAADRHRKTAEGEAAAEKAQAEKDEELKASENAKKDAKSSAELDGELAAQIWGKEGASQDKGNLAENAEAASAGEGFLEDDGHKLVPEAKTETGRHSFDAEDGEFGEKKIWDSRDGELGTENPLEGPLLSAKEAEKNAALSYAKADSAEPALEDSKESLKKKNSKIDFENSKEGLQLREALNKSAAAQTEKGAGDMRGEGRGEREGAGRNLKREKSFKIEVQGAHNSGGTAESGTDFKQAVNAAGKEVELIVETRGTAQSEAQSDGILNGGLLKEAQGSFRAEKSLENFLARELHNNLNGDIVREAQIMLRSGGDGTIKLALRPESLGKVQIKLELSDNKVLGKIIVESEEALRAFEREIHNLEEAFREGGFDGASLDASLAGGTKDREDAREAFKTMTTGISAASYAKTLTVENDFYMENEGGALNVLA